MVVRHDAAIAGQRRSLRGRPPNLVSMDIVALPCHRSIDVGCVGKTLPQPVKCVESLPSSAGELLFVTLRIWQDQGEGLRSPAESVGALTR